MDGLHEVHRVGRDALAATTALLQRVSTAHPTAGLCQAAEIEFWWSTERSTDSVPQLFWVDDLDRPAAAVTVTDFGESASLVYEAPTLVITVMPGSTREWLDHVVERGLAHVAGLGVDAVELEVDRADDVMRELVGSRGFTRKDDGVVECWLDAAKRPPISALHDGYRLLCRSETLQRPHHMTSERKPKAEQRLRETSLYRPDLDLVVFATDDAVAAYGMFWYDPVTATGVVEPMRTHDEHRQRGLARHVLTSGIQRLAEAGAVRISIGYEPGNPASGALYRSVGFEPHRQTDLFAGRTS